MILRVSVFPKQNSQTLNVFLGISGLKNHTFCPQLITIAENFYNPCGSHEHEADMQQAGSLIGLCDEKLVLSIKRNRRQSVG